MNKYVLLTALAVFFEIPVGGPVAAAQPRLTGFGTPKEDVAWALASYQLGVYAVGTTGGDLHGPQQGKGDAFIRKYGVNKKLLWGRQFGTSAADHAWGATVDAGGNVYVVGGTDGALATAHGDSDGFVRKYSADGRVLWTRQFGTENREYVGNIAVSDEDVYVAGHVVDKVTGDDDALIRKFDSSGRAVWSKTFGAAEVDYANGVDTDGAGNVYLVGMLDGVPLTDGFKGADMYIRKYTPGGTVVWTRRLDYSGSEIAHGVAVVGSSVYLAGYYRRNGSDDRDARLVKFTADGAKLWERRFDLGGRDYVYNLSAFRDGVVFAGQVVSPRGDSDGFVVKVAAKDGGELWRRKLASPKWDVTWAVAGDATGVYAAGETGATFGSGDNSPVDAYLTRLGGESGEPVWTEP